MESDWQKDVKNISASTNNAFNKLENFQTALGYLDTIIQTYEDEQKKNPDQEKFTIEDLFGVQELTDEIYADGFGSDLNSNSGLFGNLVEVLVGQHMNQDKYENWDETQRKDEEKKHRTYLVGYIRDLNDIIWGLIDSETNYTEGIAVAKKFIQLVKDFTNEFADSKTPITLLMNYVQIGTSVLTVTPKGSLVTLNGQTVTVVGTSTGSSGNQVRGAFQVAGAGEGYILTTPFTRDVPKGAALQRLVLDEPEVLLGDVNNDDKFNAADVVFAASYMLNYLSL